MRDNTTTRLTTLAAATAAAGLGVSSAQADIVHTTANAVVDATHPDFDVDFRGNGTAEFRVHYDIATGLVANKTGNNSPSYIGTTTQVHALSLGDTLSPSDPGFTTLDFLGAPVINDGGGGGEFFASDGEKYIGVKLSTGEVGWIGIRTFNDSSAFNVNAIVYDFAYDTNPNNTLSAGVVPEPSSLALLAMGATALASYRRRHQL